MTSSFYSLKRRKIMKRTHLCALSLQINFRNMLFISFYNLNIESKKERNEHLLCICLNARHFIEIQFSSVESLGYVRPFVTPWTAARQASLFITNSRSLLKLMSIKWVLPSNHLILCHPLLLPPSIFPSIRVFSNESVLCIRWPKSYMTIGKTIALTRHTFIGKVMSLLFNMLSRLVVNFLRRSKHLLISWLQSPSEVILEPPPKKIVSHCFHCLSIHLT